MAALDEANRTDVWAGYQHDESRLHRTLGLTKVELRAAVDATDDWIDDNAGAYNAAVNAALPEPGALTTKQKTKMFLAVASRRYDVT